jgi:hypothetical protein
MAASLFAPRGGMAKALKFIYLFAANGERV